MEQELIQAFTTDPDQTKRLEAGTMLARLKELRDDHA